MDVITDKLTAPFAGDADIVLLADLSSPSPTNSYIGVNFLIEAIAFVSYAVAVWRFDIKKQPQA